MSSRRKGRKSRRKQRSSSSSSAGSSSSSSSSGDAEAQEEAAEAEQSAQESGSDEEDGSDSEASSGSQSQSGTPDAAPGAAAGPPGRRGPAAAEAASGGRGGRAPEAEAARAPPPKGRQDVPLIVSGCGNATISEIIHGTYYPYSSHHGKVVYKKEDEDDDDSGALDVLIYYWDDRDGPELCGWWFGPNTGGEMVWAYHPSRKATTPPAAEWNVPHDGPIDPHFTVTAARPGEGKRLRPKDPDSKQDDAQGPSKQARTDAGTPDCVTIEVPLLSKAADKGQDAKAKEREPSTCDVEAQEKKARARSPEAVPDLPHAEGSAVGTQAYFVNAYKRRREERARAEEEERRDGQGSPEAAEGEQETEAERRRREGDRRQREEERRSREERQKREEQRRQREEQQRRYDEERGRRREEQLQRPQAAEGAAGIRPVDGAAPSAEEPKRAGEQEEDLKDLEQEEEEDKRILEELKRRADERRKRQEAFQKKKLAEHSRREETEKESRKRGEEDRHEDSKQERRRKDDEQQRLQEEAQKKSEGEGRRAGRSREKKEKHSRRSSSKARKGERSESRRRAPTVEGARHGADEEAQRMARQQRAISAVLACFEKLSEVSLESFPEIEAEFEQVMKTELPETGAQQDILKVEANRVFGFARQYVEQIKEQQRTWEEMKVKKEKEEKARREEERRRQEEEEHIKRVQEEEKRRKHEEEKRAREEERKRKEEENRLAREREQAMKEEEEQRRKAEEERKRREERPVEVQLSKEELRRRKEEERRRHEEELQRRREERRKRERSEQEKEEEKRRAEREARRREEEEKRREQREREGELERQRAEEEKVKREEEAKVRREQQATLAVLRGLQKLSDANPENFEALRAEFEQVMKTELPDTGAQQEMLKAEAERVFGYAQQYVEQVKAQQKQAEELEAQRQARAKAQEKIALELLEDLQRRATQAEAAAERAQAALAPLTAEQAPEDRDVLRVACAVERAGQAALAACASCTDFLEQKRSSILEAEALREESTKLLQMAQPRIAAAERLTQEAFKQGRSQRDRVAKQLAPKMLLKKAKDAFELHDKDSDGLLCRAEILEYAKEEFSFKIPDENLERIFHQLVAPGAKGVDFARFQQLKTAIGIARHEEKGRTKGLPSEDKDKSDENATAREAHIQEKEEEKASLSKALLASMKMLEDKVQAAERSAEEVTGTAAALGLKELLARSSTAGDTIAATRAELGTVRQRARGLRRDLLRTTKLRERLRPELATLGETAGTYSSRLRKVAGMVASSRRLALGKAFERYENLRLEVAGKLRACIEALGGKAVDLFQVVSKGAGDSVTTAEVRAFLSENKCQLEPEKLDRIFVACSKGIILEEDGGSPDVAGQRKVDQACREGNAGGESTKAPENEASREQPESKDEGAVPKDSASKEGEDRSEEKRSTDPTEGSGKKESHEAGAEAAKTQGLGEVQEGAGGKNGLTPLRIGRDDFMRIVRVYCKVVKEIALSDTLMIEGSQQIRQMEVGEVVEVFQGPVVEPSVSVLRVHGRALRDGAMGWVTISGSQGATFLVPGGNVMRVARPVALTEELKESPGARPLRTLAAGEVLELLDWARTSRSALGVTRVRARVRGDGAVGWATATDGAGGRHLEAL